MEQPSQPTAIESTMPEPHVAEPRRWFQLLMLSCAWLLFAFFTLSPLVLIETYEEESHYSPGPIPLGVGIGVLLRVALHRLFRGGFQHILRTSFGTFIRASARALTQRIVRVFVDAMLGLISKDYVQRETNTGRLRSWERQHPLVALLLGVMAMMLSLAGIFWFYPEKAAPFEANVSTPSPLTPLVACGISALPLMVYAALTSLLRRWAGIEHRLITPSDGLLLQAYFTGAGVFLPMATESEYDGDPNRCAWVAGGTLLGLSGMGGICFLLASFIGSELLTFTGGMFLLYSFIFSFCIEPLEGSFLWRRSKLLWLAVFFPIVVAFLTSLPATMDQIL
ncbi:Hypothetical protein PBC10988_33720 [Planctomycetales bacterium 10988]|nr:Hypothetical protein PBC10988_33720 [Planctomycetales bacterium 10988]